MAGEEVASDLVSDNLAVLKCLKCSKKVANGVRCFKCEQVSHLKCASLDPKSVLVTNGENSVDAGRWACLHCRPTQATLTSSHLMLAEGEVIPVRQELEIIMLKNENELLKTLLAEMGESNLLLKEKILRIEAGHNALVQPLNYAQVLSADNKRAKGRKNREDKKDCDSYTNLEKVSTPTVNKTSSVAVPGVRSKVHAVAQAQSVQDMGQVSELGQERAPSADVGTSNQDNRATENSAEGISGSNVNSSGEFKQVTYKKAAKSTTATSKAAITRSRMLTTVGTNSAPNNLISAAPKMMWIHVGKLKKEMIAENIIEYVQSKIPGIDVVCVKLNSEGQNSAFKLGAEFTQLKSLTDPTFWPTGVTIRRFFHHQPKRERLP